MENEGQPSLGYSADKDQQFYYHYDDDVYEFMEKEGMTMTSRRIAVIPA